jgi:hypothetical protein
VAGIARQAAVEVGLAAGWVPREGVSVVAQGVVVVGSAASGGLVTRVAVHVMSEDASESNHWRTDLGGVARGMPGLAADMRGLTTETGRSVVGTKNSVMAPVPASLQTHGQASEQET